MKVQKPKISYSQDVDILMIQLSQEKVNDSYDTDNMIVQIDKEGRPVILEIFNGKHVLDDLNQVLSKKIPKKSSPLHSIAHRIK